MLQLVHNILIYYEFALLNHTGLETSYNTISKPFKENKQSQRKCFHLTWIDISCTFMLPKIHPVNLSSMHLDMWKI